MDHTGEIDEVLQRKREEKLQTLAAMEASRRQKVEQRRQESSTKIDPSESIGFFMAEFNTKHSDILRSLLSPPHSFDTTAIESVSNQITSLEHSLSAASYFLPSYDLRTCQDIVAKLWTDLASIRQKLQPRKKFSFGNRKDKPESENSQRKVNNPPPSKQAEPSTNHGHAREVPGVNLMDLTGQTIRISRQEMSNCDVTLQNLKNCTVILPGSMAALFMHQIDGCTILSGSVLGAVHAENIYSSVVVVAAHQIRIHGTKKTDFYLRVRSRPIVEHTEDVHFAPYCFSYSGMDADLDMADLREENGNWERVDDFRWLRTSQSPNWSVLAVDKRMQFSE